jgi:hypothetical protein
MTILYILCSFGAYFSGFGIKYQEKSGNPGTGADGSARMLVYICQKVYV